MELVFSAIKTLVLGFIGLIVVLVVLALVFGKRVRKQWAFEAEFRDAEGREFAEFDIEKSRIQKVEADYTVKARLWLRHPSLSRGRVVRVYLDDVLALEGTVEKAGRLRLWRETPLALPDDVAAGQVCRLVIDGGEAFTAELTPD